MVLISHRDTPKGQAMGLEIVIIKGHVRVCMGRSCSL
jgi:hypothetical protein